MDTASHILTPRYHCGILEWSITCKTIQIRLLKFWNRVLRCFTLCMVEIHDIHASLQSCVIWPRYMKTKEKHGAFTIGEGHTETNGTSDGEKLNDTI